MIKRLLSIILAITMVVSLLPTTVFAYVYYGGTISSDIEEREDTICLNADTTIAEGVTFALVASYYQHIEFNYHVLTNYGTITTANSSNEFDGGTFYNYGVCEITGFYNVTVYDLTLSSIALSSGTLSPSFAAGTREYAVTVDNSVTSIDITPTLNTGTGVKSMTVNGTTATSGAASTVSLSVGENSIPIVITAGDGSDTTNTYILTVTRASAADYTITNALFVSAGTLGISQDMLQWSDVDAPGGYKLEIYTESGTQVYTGTLTNNYTPASEVLTTSGSYYFIVYALDTDNSILSGKQSNTFSYTHTHTTEIQNAKDATCTEDGYTGDEVCTVCGETITSGKVIPATGHTTEIQNAKDATCTEDGYTGDGVCTVCGETVTAGGVIPATGHTTEIQNAKDATCTEDGYTGDEVCTVCGETVTAGEVIPATGHTTEIQNAKDATCTEDGYTGDKVCTVCGETVTAGEVIPATGHTAEIQNAKDATCTEDGYTGDKVCTVCGETVTAGEVIPATGHTTEIQNAKDATCTEEGYTGDKVCTICGETITSGEVIPATGHTYDAGVVTKEATCTENGEMTYTCTVCGYSYTETIPATGHSYGAPDFAWESDYSTCTATFTCDNDNSHVETADCTVSSEPTAATCTEDGKIVYTAKVTFNGTEYTDTKTEAIAATGHTYGEPVFTWNGNTCTATFTCTECDDVQTVDATVTSKNFFGMVTRTAEVTFGGTLYTDTKITGRSLLTIMADYTSVNNAISKANALNASDYSNFADVTAAINAVQWNLNVLNQSTVNGYAEAIETAISNLKTAELTEETVTINEPIEDTNTETEPDDIEIDDTDEDQNPTTGIALAMLPMAVAAMSVVINKRR